ncbi:hypothetical protein OG897_33610 [Streptomyces sp. NBC_00237]|uniref:hypothetical protein n=1 Tax=Streptomyces sp. NBC_00237 TaxID=2975687 RepID=UPI0022527BB6|nr:hypothetical protein [Streptomyces sp. NBC_00237]MCX5206331.1 hypothetical protein [Streptomyces sp. NBC_00237]
MTTSAISTTTPIYDLLVQELGDALTASRVAARQTQAEAQQALDWSGPRIAAPRQERPFSAFGHTEGEERGHRPALPGSAP